MAHILIVDDEEPVLTMLGMTLNRLGHTVTKASNGDEALKVFPGSGADLIIMDLIMPGKEGFETIMLLRKNQCRAKILAISGGGRIAPEDILPTALRLGANAVLSKPFTREQLVEALDRLLPAGNSDELSAAR